MELWEKPCRLLLRENVRRPPQPYCRTLLGAPVPVPRAGTGFKPRWCCILGTAEQARDNEQGCPCSFCFTSRATAPPLVGQALFLSRSIFRTT